MRKEKFVLLGVSSDSSAAKLRAYAEREKMTWPIVLDGNAPLGPNALRWGVNSWPSVFIVDAEGTLRHAGIRTTDLPALVRNLLDEPKSRPPR